MVIKEVTDQLIMVTQPAHAWISGQIARLWGGDGFILPDPQKELCFAANHHDDGWIDRDTHPLLNPETGYPYDFRNIPIDDHLAIWNKSAGRANLYSRFATLLVSRHVMGLCSMLDLKHKPEQLRDKVKSFKEGQHVLQKKIIKELKGNSLYRPYLNDDNLEQHRKLLSVFDYLSLFIILDESPEVTLDDIPSPDGPVSIHISKTETHASHKETRTSKEEDNPVAFTVTPWPFITDHVRLRCDAFRLKGRCTSQEELERMMKQSDIVMFSAQLIPVYN